MRKIIHLDMDAFFAAVEIRDNPKLQNLPVAVGGYLDRRGVLCTSNYVARKYGVKSAMPTSIALKLCPDLVIIRPNFKKYSEASEKVFKIFEDYTDLIEPMSLDEAYLDVTNCSKHFNSATWIAQEIRFRIFKELNLTASAGISTNKLLAKLASDYQKPNGQFTVAPNGISQFIESIQIERIPGVGKVTAQRLHELEIKNCKDLQTLSQDFLNLEFGKFGETLYDFCRGIDEREVENEHERKSLGVEETFLHDLTNIYDLKVQLVTLVEDLRNNLLHFQDRIVKSIQVKIKYFDFKQTTIERNLPIEIESFIKLLEERWSFSPAPVRLLGVGVKFSDSSEIDPIEVPQLLLI